ncbi:MAG: zinc-binding dehydrogenase, partial [Ilumatobacteraceae bacterium]
MSRLVFSRKPAKFAMARLAGAIMPGAGAHVGPLDLEADEPLPLPTPEWVRLRTRLAGICGSDLSMIDGTASAYFDPLVSYPFTPGHEVVADVFGGETARRVVLVPVLSCITRGISPMCHACEAGHINLCERIAYGHLEPGLQSGFCTDTGGGWAHEMVAHPSQLVDVPADLSDEAAVLIEPTACAVHAAARYTGKETVIIGAGTLGLLTLAAITATHTDRTAPIVVTARYAEQKRLAKELGADIVCSSDEMPRYVRSATKSLMIGDQLTCGAPHVIDCVGSSDSLQQALRVVAPGGEVQVVGMPSNVSLELTSLWHRETAIRGCYAYD